MKKLGLLFRETLENRIKSYLKESNSVFIITYSKLSSSDLTVLRKSLKGTKANLFVAKNSLVRRALKDSKLDDLAKCVQESCGLVFVKEDPIDTTRVLWNFSKEHEQLKFRGGLLKDRNLDKEDIETLAKLPAKAVLRAQVVIILNSPISGLVFVLSQTLRKFIYCLDQIKIAKSQNKQKE